jgi:hypothetical protein
VCLRESELTCLTHFEAESAHISQLKAVHKQQLKKAEHNFSQQYAKLEAQFKQVDPFVWQSSACVCVCKPH